MHQPRGGNMSNYQPPYQQHQQPGGYGHMQQYQQQPQPLQQRPPAGSFLPQQGTQAIAASSHHHQHHSQFHHQQTHQQWQHQHHHHHHQQQQQQSTPQQQQQQQEASTYYQQQLRAAYQAQQANYAAAYYQQHAGNAPAGAGGASAAAAQQQQNAYYAQYYAGHSASHSSQPQQGQRHSYESGSMAASGQRYPPFAGAGTTPAVQQQQSFAAPTGATSYATGSHTHHHHHQSQAHAYQQQQYPPQQGSYYRGGYHTHHHHQHQQYPQSAYSAGTEAASYRGGGGYRGGYAGNYRGGFAPYRGGDPRRGGGGYGSYHQGSGGHYGGKEYNFVVHVDSFEAVAAFERSTEPFSLLPPQTLTRIQRTSRDSPDIHLLVVVGGRYLGGFFKRFDRHIRVIPQALAERFADLRWAVTEQGTPFYRTFDDGALIPRHYYVSLRQVIHDVMDIASGERRPRRGVPEAEATAEDGEPVVIESDADVLQLTPAKFLHLLVRNINVADAALRLASVARKDPNATDEARAAFAFFEAVLDHDTHFFSSTVGLKLLDTLLLNRETRAEIFDRLATFVQADKAKVEAAAASSALSAQKPAEPTSSEAEKPAGEAAAEAPSSDAPLQPPQSYNLLQSLGYGIFKQLLVHPFSTKFALQILGRVSLTLQDGTGRSEAEEEKEVRIFSQGFEVYGFDAVCGNLGGATLAALVGRYVFKAPRDDQKAKSQNTTAAAEGNEANAEEANQNADAATCRKRSRTEAEDGPDATTAADGSSTQTDGDSNEPSLVDSSKQLANREQLIRSIVVAFTRGVDTEAGVTVGVMALARHVLACRTIQCMSPIILRAAATAAVPSLLPNDSAETTGDSLSTTKERKVKLSDAMTMDAKCSHAGRCFCFLEVLCSQAAVLMVDNYGNYVMQTLVEEMTKEIASNNSVAQPLVALLRLMQRNMNPSLWDIATSKFGSNCIERFVVATATLPAEIGDEFLVTLSDCVLGLGSQAFLQLCVHSFGNYPIRQMLLRLSAIAGAASSSADGAEQQAAPATPLTWKAAAQKNEKLLFDIVTRGLKTMEATVCATGIRSWYQSHAVRINAQIAAPQAEGAAEGN